MATMKLLPSTYYLSNTSYLSIASANNMYTDTTSTTYATVTNSQNGTTSYYLYIRGFNFSAIPADAIVNSFTVRFKARESGASTSTSYRPYLCNNTTTITGNCGVVNTTAQVIEFTGVTATWDTIKGYGANFGIRINCRRSSRNTTAYMYVYGAEIEVDYTIPVYHSLTASCTGGTVDPASATVLEGTSQTFRFDGATGRESLSSLTVNGTNVLSQAVKKSLSEPTYAVEALSGATYGFALSGNYYVSQNKAKASSAAVCKVSFVLPVECTVDFYVINYAEATYDYGLLSNVDQTFSTSASADTTSYWSGKNNNSASEQKVSYTIPAGEHFITAKYYKDGYTDSNNDTLQFRVVITPNSTVPSDTFYYEYTASNITADLVIVGVFGEITGPFMYTKVNGAWTSVSAVYKKVNGSWVLQSNLANLFDTSANYVKG